MDITLLPSNELVYNLPEIHNFIFQTLKKETSNKYNNIFCDIFTENAVSFDRENIHIDQPYKVLDEYQDTFKLNNGIINLMDNIKIFKIYLPLQDNNYYLGTIYANMIESRDNNYHLQLSDFHQTNIF